MKIPSTILSCTTILVTVGGGWIPSENLLVAAFSSPVFVREPLTIPSKTTGVDVSLPDFDELFTRIQMVSPLARVAVQRRDGGFFIADDENPLGMKWKTVESNKRKVVHQIDKIDNFQNLGSPILRYRSSLQGPCLGERFANFIMNLEERKKWDMQIVKVDETHPVHLEDVNRAMGGGGKYGECIRCGVGYCQTKANLVVSSREQLTLCGIQEFRDTGATLIWGVEMEDRHNHLMPPGERHTRARSHLFSTVLVPTGDNSFDVEYVLQLDAGGKVPGWLITPVITETVKSLFNHAKGYFSAGPGSEIDKYLKAREAIDSAFHS